MRRLPHILFVPLTSLSLLFLAGSGVVSGADDIESTRVHFSTYDEVELSGTFYRSAPTNGKKDKDTVVLLLHDFRHLKGGSSQEDGWHQLAGQLQKEGFAVLSFDFRGFGNSKSVSPKFWEFPHNRQGIKGASRKNPPASIDEKDFSQNYFINLVNDIAAARAYLNIKNDANEINSSNIILIGAGQGATLGALWLASECRRQKDNQSDRLALIPGMLPQFRSLDEPEGNDVAAAVWLTIYPTLEQRPVGRSVINALVDETKKAKIPTYFLYAKNDKKANDFLNLNSDLKSLLTENSKKKGGVKEKAVPGAGDLAGSKLLSSRYRTAEFILDYVNNVVEERGSRTRKDRQDQKYAFCWSLPWPAQNANRIVSKLPGQPVSHTIPVNVLGLR